MSEFYFVSLGLFILDDIYWSGQLRDTNIIGGGGTFALIGSKYVLSKFNADSLSDYIAKCSMIIDIGPDCPQDVIDTMVKYKTDAVFRRSERLTIRGGNYYGDNDFRDFKYLTPKKSITWDDIKANGLDRSKSYHIISSGENLLQFIQDKGESSKGSIITWEPTPTYCTPENLSFTLEVIKRIDLFSPNAAEAASYFGLPEPKSKQECLEIAKRFASYIKEDAAVVIRCGALGSCAVVKDDLENVPWCDPPAGPNVDPTGCGNTYLGALTTAYVITKNLNISMNWASKAASLCLAVKGLPKLEEANL
ncbi:Mak32 protein [Martiniozyma asiatica (nom. inval.)]|nr:Mak32 protein [Martiniozyma asiatica]